MFFICHYHLHPSFQFGDNDVHGGMRISTCISLKETPMQKKLVKELVNRKLGNFRRYHVNVKHIKWALWWSGGPNLSPCGLTIGLLACQLFSFVKSQMNMENIFPRIHINLRKYCSQVDNLYKLIFVKKNWPNDCRVNYKSPSNLLEN
jgi:hypothetical protein